MEVRRADPAVRRQVVVALVISTCVGALLIIAFERYRVSLSEWILADPGVAAQRLTTIFRLLVALVLGPLLAFAAYLWSLGNKVVRAREFPPPGLRVIRDTPIITGERAASRGRILKALAYGCCVACVVFGVLLWRVSAWLH
jgi:hypothetical protein